MLERATFITRDACISCGSPSLRGIAEGRFDEPPLRDFIASDPWGEHPAPFLVGAKWHYVECADCGQRFHRNILSPPWQERRFDKWMSAAAIDEFLAQRRTPKARLNHARSNIAHALRIELLTRKIRTGAVRVLDFGCGDGEFLACCHAFGFEALGVDRSNQRHKRNPLPIASNLEQIEGNFHAATLFEVTEHLDDPLSVLRQLRQRTVDGGILIVETPDCAGVNGIRTREDYDLIHPLEHINGFTARTLSAIAERAGFRRIRTPIAFVTADSIGIAKATARSFLARDSTQQYFVAV